MSDEKLRELERRWRASGRVEDEAAYLAEQVRVGHLTRDHLRLPAYLDHKASQLVLGKNYRDIPDDFREWINGIWPNTVVVRAGIAVITRVLPEFSKDNPDSAMPHQITHATARWVICPCQKHAFATMRRVRFYLDGTETNSSLAFGDIMMSTVHLAQATSSEYHRAVDNHKMAAKSIAELSRLLIGSLIPQPTARKAIHDDVALWLLGRKDPLDHVRRELQTDTP